jgi:hypothetical protein
MIVFAFGQKWELTGDIGVGSVCVRGMPFNFAVILWAWISPQHVPRWEDILKISQAGL